MDEAATRKEIRSILEKGTTTEVLPRADTTEQGVAIALRLRTAPDLKAKLVIGGFALAPVQHEGAEQACETCINFLVHRRFCDQPELQLPVEPEWSCRIWKV